MESIVNFLSSVATGISNLFDVIITFFKDFVAVISLVTKIPGYVVAYLAWIPQSFMFAGTVLLTVVVIYKIMGRD